MLADNDLLSMQQARILAENAASAQKKLAALPQARLDEFVEVMADAVEPHARELAVMSREETDYGRWQDKLRKNLFVCRDVRRALRGQVCVGILPGSGDKGDFSVGVPLGVIVALSPVTSPVSTTVNTALLAVKTGNAVIFSPHPRAGRSIRRALTLMRDAAEKRGLPAGCLSWLEPVARSGTETLFLHPATSLVLLTGVEGLLDAARRSGKPLIVGGTGNGPVFIERSACLEQAVKDIIESKTFDNGLAPSAELSIVVDAAVDDAVRRIFRQQGAYFMDREEALRVARLFFAPDGRRRKSSVGLSAADLARRADVKAPDDVRLLLADRRYVTPDDPYGRELLAPALAYYVEDDWMHACERCIELLLNERGSHTLVVHSRNEDVIRQFALQKPVARLLVNTPAAFGGVGMTTSLFPAMTLGAGQAGRGIISDNLSPGHLVYIRRVGYGVRPVPAAEQPVEAGLPDGVQTDRLRAVRDVLHETLKVLSAENNRG